jgi:hypothetical protein
MSNSTINTGTIQNAPARRRPAAEDIRQDASPVYPGLVYTGAIWALASIPVWGALLNIALGAVYETAYNDFWRTTLVIALVLTAAALTMRDRKLLIESGLRRTTSAWWFLLTPTVYLLLRAVRMHRLSGEGWGPLLLWLGCLATPIVTAAAAALGAPALF